MNIYLLWFTKSKIFTSSACIFGCNLIELAFVQGFRVPMSIAAERRVFKRPATHAFRFSNASLAAFQAAADVFLVCLALFLAEMAYSGSIIYQRSPWVDLLGLGVGIGAIFGLHIGWRGGYETRLLWQPRKQLALTALSWLVVFFLIGWVAFLTKTIGDVSRVSIALFFVFGFALVAGGRMLFQWLLRRAIENARIVTGTAFAIIMGDEARRHEVLHQMRDSGVQPVGIHLIRADLDTASVAHEFRRAIDQVRKSLSVRRYDAVHVYVPWSNLAAISELRRIVNHSALPTILMADPMIESIVAGRSYDDGQQRGFELQRPPLTLAERSLKRCFDLFVASTLLLLLSPVMLIVALAVRLESKGPALFMQDRRGFGGKPFRIYKFRSMRVMENGADIKQAQKGDPRITMLGAILRRTSIDELPQLFNVLRGDMSLVGPRPHAVAHDNKFDVLIARYATRQHVKPGVTGYAQVNGFRGETRTIEAMSGRVERDIWYVNNWSIWLDLRILAKTLIVTLFDRNAY